MAKYTRVTSLMKRKRVMNAGLQVMGVHKRNRSDRLYYYDLKEMKPSILSVPDKSIFEYLNRKQL